jgi:ATP-dependent DNA helicase RecG
MVPPLRPEFTVDTVQGAVIVAIEVAGLPPEQRPCYYGPQGLQSGSYIRVGNTNRRMTDYEVFGYVSSRTQPTFDEEPVGNATVEDLDTEALAAYVAELRRTRPGAGYLQGQLNDVLRRLSVIRRVGGVSRPTLGSLLVFGRYPQEFEPQLVITFLHYYGTSETELTPRGERFLDNRKFEGAIPEMIESAVDHVMVSVRKAGLIDGLRRRDVPDTPWRPCGRRW